VSKVLAFSAYTPFDYAAPRALGSAQGVETSDSYCSIILEKYNNWLFSGHPMLTQLTKLLTSKESGLSLAEISRALGAQPSAVMSMLGLLVQKGRLVEIGPDGGQCAKCGSQSD